MKNIYNAFINILRLTISMAKSGLYDDEFTPSNIIYTNDDAVLIDAGTLFAYNPEVQINPFNNELCHCNIFGRLLYRIIMVYFIRLERIGRKEEAYKQYKLFLPLFMDTLYGFQKEIKNSRISSYYGETYNFYNLGYHKDISLS